MNVWLSWMVTGNDQIGVDTCYDESLLIDAVFFKKILDRFGK